MSGFAIRRVTSVDLPSALALYGSVGWTAYTRDPGRLARALAGSSTLVTATATATATQGDALLGLARVISDGASIAYLQDVLVHPDAQRRGIGRALVEAALEPYADVRQKVLLTDDEPAQRAYEALGYSELHDFGDGTLRGFVRFDEASPEPDTLEA